MKRLREKDKYPSGNDRRKMCEEIKRIRETYDHMHMIEDYEDPYLADEYHNIDSTTKKS